MDVARKLIILGREMGMPLELKDVELEGLVPKTLIACSPQEFMDRLPELDSVMLRRLEAANARQRVLRYVASLDAATSAPRSASSSWSARIRSPTSTSPTTSSAS